MQDLLTNAQNFYLSWPAPLFPVSINSSFMMVLTYDPTPMAPIILFPKEITVFNILKYPLVTKVSTTEWVLSKYLKIQLNSD